jgi:hypothetical protein
VGDATVACGQFAGRPAEDIKAEAPQIAANAIEAGQWHKPADTGLIKHPIRKAKR